ncbi:hypothetical protein MM239_16980 [Belliella sp. DSM 111904]|uniref:Tetratricopeptide repeat-containing protein n=1 Tax=Belliella filtrata TaxID=2923435 RepID=A0ABS9V402_9BACT|nr:hypothetical protein [Belliella filtrata]MCH7411103.1 hypothetical protein [Belliella filtrata]
MNNDELTDLGNGIFVDDKGNVTGSHSVNINGQTFTVNISCSFEKLEEKERISNNPNSVIREPKEDEMILPISFKLEILVHFPKECFREKQESLLKGYNNFIVKKSDFHKGMIEYKNYTRQMEILRKTAELNNKGIDLEKKGYIDEAITVYEENIKLGYPASHSYERLMILYSKKKDYKKEKRTIERALEIYPNSDKYKKRLEKLNLKLNK